jgi:hypothetical protein
VQHAVNQQRPEPLNRLSASDEDQLLSRKTKRNLSIRDDDSPPNKSPAQSPTRKHHDTGSTPEETNEPESTASEEVGELAGYLDELYLPRANVSADAALMVELMYT